MNEVQSEIQKRKDKKDADKVKNNEQLFATWTKEQEELLAEWSEKGSCYRWLHSRAEKKYRCRNYAFTIPVIIMSTLTGTANFAMDSFVPEGHKKVAMACVGGVNILAGIITTLQNFLRYAELMESHRSSGVSWSKLSRDICVELALDPPRRKPAGDFLNVCRAEYDRLIEQSPMIDDSILSQFHSKFGDSDINKPEMCNGLDKCEIYKPSEEEKVASIMNNAASKFSSFKLSNVNNESREMKEHKKELQGLSSMGRVSNMKHIKVKAQNVKKDNVHSELMEILEKNDIESNTKDTDVTEVNSTGDTGVNSTDVTEVNSTGVNSTEDNSSELDQGSNDFLSVLVDGK